MIITLFGDTVVRPGEEEAEARLIAKLKPILRNMPGFISYGHYVADDEEAIGIIRFDSRESLDGWVHEGVHGEAQRIAHEHYESFRVQTAETYREYTWENGNHADGELTDLFSSVLGASPSEPRAVPGSTRVCQFPYQPRTPVSSRLRPVTYRETLRKDG